MQQKYLQEYDLIQCQYSEIINPKSLIQYADDFNPFPSPCISRSEQINANMPYIGYLSVEYVPYLEYTPSYIIVITSRYETVIFKHKNAQFVHDLIFVTNLGIYRLIPEQTGSILIDNLFQQDYVNRQYGFVSKQIKYNGQFKIVYNIKLPINLKPFTYEYGGNIYTLDTMSQRQYGKVLEQYRIVNKKIPVDARQPNNEVLDLSIQSNSQLQCLNPLLLNEIVDLDLYTNKKPTVQPYDVLYKFGVYIVDQPDVDTYTNIRPFQPVPAGQLEFRESFICQLVVLDSLLKGKTFYVEDLVALEDLTQIIMVSYRKLKHKLFLLLTRNIELFKVKRGIKYQNQDILYKQLKQYTILQYSHDLNTDLLENQQYLLNAIGDAFGRHFYVYEGVPSCVDYISDYVKDTYQYTNYLQSTFPNVVYQIKPPLSVLNQEKWKYEARAVYDEKLIINIPGLDTIIMDLDTGKSIILLHEFAYRLVTQIHHCDLFYQLAWDGGLGSDLVMIRSRILLTLKNIIDQFDVQTGRTLYKNELYAIRDTIRSITTEQGVVDVFLGQIDKANYDYYQRLMKCKQIIQCGYQYDKRDTSESEKISLVAIINQFIQVINPFDDNHVTSQEYVYNETFKYQLDHLFLSRNIRHTVSHTNFMGLQLDQHIMTLNADIEEYLQTHSEYMLGMYLLEEQKHIYKDLSTMYISQQQLQQTFKYQPVHPESTVLLYSVFELLLNQFIHCVTDKVNGVTTPIVETNRESVSMFVIKKREKEPAVRASAYNIYQLDILSVPGKIISGMLEENNTVAYYPSIVHVNPAPPSFVNDLIKNQDMILCQYWGAKFINVSSQTYTYQGMIRSPVISLSFNNPEYLLLSSQSVNLDSDIEKQIANAFIEQLLPYIEKRYKQYELTDTIFQIAIPPIPYISKQIEDKYIADCYLQVMNYIQLNNRIDTTFANPKTGQQIPGKPIMKRSDIIRSDQIQILPRGRTYINNVTSTIVDNSALEQLPPNQELMYQRYLDYIIDDITSLLITYDKHAQKITLDVTLQRGTVLPTQELVLRQIKSNVWTSYGQIVVPYSGRVLTIQAITYSINVVKLPSGQLVSRYSPRLKQADFPTYFNDYDDKAEGMYMSDRVDIKIEGYRIMSISHEATTVKGIQYGPNNHSLVNSSLKQYAMSRAIYVSRFALNYGYQPEHLNSRGFIKYIFCYLMSKINGNNLQKYEQLFEDVNQTVVNYRVPVLQNPVIQNQVYTTLLDVENIPPAVDKFKYSSSHIQQCISSIQSILTEIKDKLPNITPNYLLARTFGTADDALVGLFTHMLLENKEYERVLQDLLQRARGDNPQLFQTLIYITYGIWWLIRANGIDATQTAIDLSNDQAMIDILAKIHLIWDKLISRYITSQKLDEMANIQNLLPSLNVIGQPLLLTKTKTVYSGQLNQLTDQKQGIQVVQVSHINDINVFPYRNVGDVRNDVYGSPVSTNIELKKILVYDAVSTLTGYRWIDPTDPIMSVSVQNAQYRIEYMVFEHTAPPPSPKFTQYNISSLTPNQPNVIPWNSTINNIQSIIDNLALTNQVIVFGFPQKYQNAFNAMLTILPNIVQNQLSDEIIYIKQAMEIQRDYTQNTYIFVNSQKRLIQGQEPLNLNDNTQIIIQLHDYMLRYYQNPRIGDAGQWSNFKATTAYSDYDTLRQVLDIDPVQPDPTDIDLTNTTIVYLQ